MFFFIQKVLHEWGKFRCKINQIINNDQLLIGSFLKTHLQRNK